MMLGEDQLWCEELVSLAAGALVLVPQCWKLSQHGVDHEVEQHGVDPKDERG